MKKVMLSAMALMVGSLAFAQQVGDPRAEQADYAAGASSPANAVENVQSGEDNYMLVRQEGTSSSVYIDQSGGGAGVGNLVYVRQSGDVNDNQTLSGEANMADVRQDGTTNKGYVHQEGDGNEAAMVQEASVSASTGLIRQGTGENAEDNYAGMIQRNGNNNSGWIQQTFDNSEALTVQDGSNHQAKTIQNANPDNSDGHDARVEQNGTGQMSYVAQT
ncbi:curlin repeat-containing protein, partial [Cochleicola gelatinilyticus]|uniref:curlin repeat-containing protein n=1 Tax=Cochleicola gelatinilyticus TaxID=1763537 RepID=UPI0018D3DDF1